MFKFQCKLVFEAENIFMKASGHHFFKIRRNDQFLNAFVWVRLCTHDKKIHFK